MDSCPSEIIDMRLKLENASCVAKFWSKLRWLHRPSFRPRPAFWKCCDTCHVTHTRLLTGLALSRAISSTRKMTRSWFTHNLLLRCGTLCAKTALRVKRILKSMNPDRMSSSCNQVAPIFHPTPTDNHKVRARLAHIDEQITSTCCDTGSTSTSITKATEFCNPVGFTRCKLQIFWRRSAETETTSSYGHGLVYAMCTRVTSGTVFHRCIPYVGAMLSVT